MRSTNSLTRQLQIILILTSVLILLTVGGALAQENPPYNPTDDEVNAIAKELYCPVCENVPLDVCGTLACAQWRDLIREKLIAGWSEAEIKSYFADQYGARVLAEPPAQGFNWLVYIVPPAAFLVGVFILYRGFKTWRQIETDDLDEPLPIEQTAQADEYMARFEEELNRSDQ